MGPSTTGTWSPSSAAGVGRPTRARLRLGRDSGRARHRRNHHRAGRRVSLSAVWGLRGRQHERNQETAAATSPSTSRSARTSGPRSRRARTARWPGRRCSSTCRQATRRSRRLNTAAPVRGAVARGPLSAYRVRGGGHGESTTDLAWDGQAMICENGDLLASPAVRRRRRADRGRRRPRAAGRRPPDQEPLGRYAPRPPAAPGAHAPVPLRVRRRRAARSPAPAVERFPYVPSDPASRNERCEEVVPDPGGGTPDTAAGDRHREGRDRRLRRARLDPRADRRGARARPSRAAAGERARLHDARFATSAHTLAQRACA